MEEMCRLCAVLKQPEEFKCKIDDANFDVEQKLITCCNWNSFRSHNSLPKSVCIPCFLQLEQCWYFRETVSRAQQKLFGLIDVNNAFHEIHGVVEHCYEEEMVQVKCENTTDDTIDVDHIEVSNFKFESDYDDYNNDFDNANNSSDGESELNDAPSSIQQKIQKTTSKTRSVKEKVKRKKQKQTQLEQFDISKFLTGEDMNEDGTVKAEKILELNLSNWTKIKHPCYKCNKNGNASTSQSYTAPSYGDLWFHFTTNHQNEQLKYICPICPDRMIFLSDRYYREHIVKFHHPHLSYCCHKCLKFFHDSTKMRAHLKSHPKDPSSSVCSICGKGFSYYKNLYFHMFTHLPNQIQPEFHCYLCKKVLKSMSSLKFHMRQHIGVTKSKVCDQCGKAYVTASKLKEHKSIHSDERPFPCEHCPKTFKTIAILRRHMRIHQNVQKYICHICGHSTICKQRFKQHFTRYHTNDSPFPCDICKKPFYKIQTLNTHKKNVHFNVNPYPCVLCDFRGINERALKRHHKHIHLDHRPHTCNFCEYGTYSKFNLQMHISRRHRVNEERT
ncbi:zinc finger protein 724-like [Contarinia nasturtii]|uniref:zinc finger protein 724-like n=1 Tax=Contarinia nasturtii TaxID=265458 RepID=UPI0012D45CDD|nr:zinc finger protein 724-like [Contarinia nasturtii]